MRQPKPIRIQRQRTKGWRMPEGAVYVGRPTWFGNPWRAGSFVDELAATSTNEKLLPRDMVSWFGRRANEVIETEAEAVEMYRRWLIDCNNRNVPLPVPSLRGKDLACWCPLDRPCHADVLLELANGPPGGYYGMPFVDVSWSIPNAGRSGCPSATVPPGNHAVSEAMLADVTSCS